MFTKYMDSNGKIDRFPFLADTFLVDRNGRVRPTTLCCNMIGCALRHAEVRGFGATSSIGYSLGSGSTGSNDSGFNIFPLDSVSGNGDTDRLGLMLNWINNSDDARILAAPNVIADLGKEAIMETGEDLPYTENSVKILSALNGESRHTLALLADELVKGE